MDNKVIVITDLDSIFIFNKNLQFLTTVYIPLTHFNITKSLLYVSNDSLLFINESSILPKGYYLKKDNTFNVFDLTNEKKYSIFKNRRKQFKELIENNQHLLKNEFGYFELKGNIPKMDDYYGADNIDYNDSTIVFFQLTKEKFILTVYKY